MSEVKKPESVFQTFNPHEGILTVHESNDPDSVVVFHGLPEDYDGSATDPAAPTAEYIEKHLPKESDTASLSDQTDSDVSSPKSPEANSETGSAGSSASNSQDIV